MDDGDEKTQLFHNRNSRRVQEHLNVSVDNEHSNCDDSDQSQNLKIAPPNSRPTANPLTTLSSLPTTTPYHSTPHFLPSPSHLTHHHTLSTSLHHFFRVRNLLRLSLCFVIAFLTFGAPFGAEAAAARATDASLSRLNKEVVNERTFKGGVYAGGEPRKQKRVVNKNCKEYDVTSRAFLADLIFEGTARSRSKRASGRYVTFVIQKVLKQKTSLLRPKTQIRLHFGEKTNRRASRVNPLSDCPLTSITSSNRAMANVRVGEKYYVFADHFGPMNYTAKGEPIVVNRRNLKSIKSVLSRNKEKPPRVLGLQDLNLKTTQQLRLTCEVRGRPVPRINWYKDGAPLIPSSHVNVTYYRRNSTIEIKSVELKDGGIYECRAISVTGKMAKTSAHVSVWKMYTSSSEYNRSFDSQAKVYRMGLLDRVFCRNDSRKSTDPEKSFHIKKCSVDAYCLNGGQCYFIEHLGEHMCECVPGFKGARCEIKEVSAIEIESSEASPDTYALSSRTPNVRRRTLLPQTQPVPLQRNICTSAHIKPVNNA